MKKHLTGQVKSTKMQSSAIVLVETWKTNSLYGKRMRRHRKFVVQNDQNKYQTGDKVIIEECAPISKNKSWKIIGKADK